MKKWIISIIIFAGAVSLGTFYLVTQKNENKDNTKKEKEIQKEEKKECVPFTGGSFHLNLYKEETNPEAMSICIACPPDSYLDLPVPTKDGYDFDGWYYDKELTRKVEVTNTKDIPPVPEKEGNCIIGYQDISLYAKWNKKEDPVPEPVNKKEEPAPVVVEEPQTEAREELPTEPAATDVRVLRRPTTVGMMDYNIRNNDYYIKTKNYTPIYSMANGRVHKIMKNVGLEKYNYNRPVYTVSTIVVINDKPYVINYRYLTSIQVEEGQDITSDTILGNLVSITTPELYIEIYAFLDFESLYNNFHRTVNKSMKQENAFSYIDIPESREWDER